MSIEISNSMIGERVINLVKPDQLNLIMIICNHCPYVLFRMPAISQLVKDYKDRVNIVAVNSNDASPTTDDSSPEDAPELMTAFTEQWDLECAYVFDEDQGELDPSHTSNELMPTGSSLRHALDLTLIDKPITWEPNPSFGCSVKWKL